LCSDLGTRYTYCTSLYQVLCRHVVTHRDFSFLCCSYQVVNHHNDTSRAHFPEEVNNISSSLHLHSHSHATDATSSPSLPKFPPFPLPFPSMQISFHPPSYKTRKNLKSHSIPTQNPIPSQNAANVSIKPKRSYENEFAH
jgi:hypothetical protein